MTDKLGIVNAALTKLGNEPISALDGSSKRASVADEAYERVKKRLLRRHTFNFSLKRVELEANGNTPEWHFTQEFDLPEDYIRLAESRYFDKEYKIEGKKLLAHQETFQLIYVADVDEELFDSLFVDLLATSLAYELCYSLVQSVSFRSELKNELEFMLQEVRSINAQTRGTPQSLGAEDLIDERF